jgi:eukaryotic-like serine/threonine-protein kinase
MALTPSTRLGPYEIQSPLGAGGMGEVYRARDTRLGRDVAVKVLTEFFAKDPERLRRFEQEARAVAALNHPNIVAVYDIGTQDGRAYLVSELLEGETLREALHGGQLSTRKATDYAVQVASGLAAAHEKGVVHRDLKPENIFITSDGRVKILDFGLAKLVAPEAKPDEGATIENVPTSAGAVLGTVGYMSPEQVRGEPVDARSDIFALGAILYEMLSGQRAFRRDTSAETMTAILKEDPPELSSTTKLVSPAMERIVRRCLEKNPVQRFQSARDLAFNLEGVSGASSSSGAAVAPSETPASARGTKTRLLALAAGLLSLILVAAASWLLGRRSAPVSSPSYHQLTFERGLVYAARFAADGRSVYYSASWNGEPLQIYSTSPDGPESRPLNLLNSTLFAVSSSNLAISLGCADTYIGNCMGTLGEVPLAGGTPREVSSDVIAADWTADGSEMAVIRQAEGKERVEFPRGKVIYEDDHTLGCVRIAPSGNAVAFFRFINADGDAAWLIVLDRNGKELFRSGLYISTEGLAWSPSGEEVWAAATKDAGWADAIHGFTFSGQERVVLRLPGILRLHDVSRDGRILLSKESWRNGIQFRGPADSKERNLDWLDYATMRDLSADGKQLAFDDWGAASGSNGLAYLRKTDGSPAIKLGEWNEPILSPDGTKVLAISANTSTLATGLSFALLPTGVGEIQKLSSGQFVQAENMGWTPDGKAVYFAVSDGKGWRMYLQDVDGSAARPVTPFMSIKRSHVEGDLVSPDGKLMFARDVNGKGMLYPLAGGDARLVPGWLPDDLWVNWTADGRSAYIYNDNKTNASVFKLDLTTGKREPLMTLALTDPAGVTAISNVRMTPDGKTYAYTFAREMSDLFLVEGVR